MGVLAPRPELPGWERTVLPECLPADPDKVRVTTAARYRRLLGEISWAKLPEPVRKRFSKPAAPGDVTLYLGEVVATELSFAGRGLALLAKAIGAPLPAIDGATGPATVTVIEDPAFGGQTWTRVYPHPGGFPQVVHSAKRFGGPTGLEEYVGSGIGMTLALTVEQGALVFRSERYFVEAFGRRLMLPRGLEPGRMVIVHTQDQGAQDQGAQDQGARFSFRLTLTHPLFGRLIHQLAYFEEV